MADWNLCYGCMEHKSGGGACPHCGYEEGTAHLAAYLKPGTMLRDRYLVGKALSQNGEGITYMAYDCNIGCKVLIREYMPEQLCSRVPESTLINVNYNHLAQYKALMAEYTELNKSLARLRSIPHLDPALDLFAENNTTYAVFEYPEGRSLLAYLKENAGELSWNTVSRMFPPLFTTLSLLHNAGVLHRGISPETVFVTDKGTLKLGGFCISAVRTNDTELDAELYDGYAAPEQYFADRQQGTWTDVYGICAVLYRILTGCRATDANTRQDFDNLVPPVELNPRIPVHVSEGIMRGLALDADERVHSVTDLVTLLFEESAAEPAQNMTASAVPAGSTTVFDPSAAAAAARAARPDGAAHTEGRREHNHPKPHGQETVTPPRKHHQEPEKISFFERIRVPALIALLLLAIVIIVVVFFQKTLFDDEESSVPSAFSSSVNDNIVEVSKPDTTNIPRYDSVMPKLVGQYYQIKKSEMAGWLEMEAEYVYSEEYANGIIIWQEMEEGSEFMSGSTIRVQVSLGTSIKPLPAFEGYTLAAYLTKLEELGFVVNSTAEDDDETTEDAPDQKVIRKTKVDYDYANGYVCAVEPAVGTEIDLLEDYKIVIYYADNPEVTTTTPPVSSGGETTATTPTQSETEPTITTTPAPPADTPAEG